MEPYMPLPSMASRWRISQSGFRNPVGVGVTFKSAIMPRRKFYPTVLRPMLCARFTDIDGDGQVETLFADGDGYYHARRPDGREAPGWPKLLCPASGCGMAAGDLVGDGSVETVVQTCGGRIYVFDCAGSADGQAPWPLFMGSNLRDGKPTGHFPRAPRKDWPVTEQATTLKHALAIGDWASVLTMYRAAVRTVQAHAAKIGRDQAVALQQAGALSIARILNTRARRYAEAADAYRYTITLAPESWLACQALTECNDLVQWHSAKNPALRATLSADRDGLPPRPRQIVSPG